MATKTAFIGATEITISDDTPSHLEIHISCNDSNRERLQKIANASGYLMQGGDGFSQPFSAWAEHFFTHSMNMSKQDEIILRCLLPDGVSFEEYSTAYIKEIPSAIAQTEKHHLRTLLVVAGCTPEAIEQFKWLDIEYKDAVKSIEIKGFEPSQQPGILRILKALCPGNKFIEDVSDSTDIIRVGGSAIQTVVSQLTTLGFRVRGEERLSLYPVARTR